MHVSNPDELPTTFTSVVTDIEMILVHPGEFMMGDESLEFSRPPLAVKIKQPYYLAKYPLTQKQWNKVMDTRPSEFDPHPYHPQDGISWADVKVFIRLLNQLEETDLYRLPTEAEWEYACRAGTTTAYSFGDEDKALKDHGWAGFDYHNGHFAVGRKKPNPWGFCDMHGNVWEWCEDEWHETYDTRPSTQAAWMTEDGSRRVFRGGSFAFEAELCKSAERRMNMCISTGGNVGFRLARTARIDPVMAEAKQLYAEAMEALHRPVSGSAQKPAKVVEELRSTDVQTEPLAVVSVLEGKDEVPGHFLVRRVTCPNCDAPKVKSSKTAYIYCDYCASLMDWDFKIATESEGSAWVGPENKKLHEELGPKLEKARKADDREQYRWLQRQINETIIERSPATYSPRLKEENYRRRYVEYMVWQAEEMVFDKRLQKLSDKVDKKINALEWKMTKVDGAPKPMVSSNSFWNMFEAYHKNMEVVMAVCKEKGLVDLWPDEEEWRVSLRMTDSLFVQGWLPYLVEVDQKLLLAKLGFVGQYHEVPKPDLTRRQCGWCGASLDVVKNADRVVCEYCAHIIDVNAPEFPCPACTNPISLPVGVRRLRCPACDSEVASTTPPDVRYRHQMLGDTTT